MQNSKRKSQPRQSNVIHFPRQATSSIFQMPLAGADDDLITVTCSRDFPSIGLLKGDLLIVNERRQPDSGFDLCAVRSDNGVVLRLWRELSEEDQIEGVVVGYQRSFFLEA